MQMRQNFDNQMVPTWFFGGAPGSLAGSPHTADAIRPD